MVSHRRLNPFAGMVRIRFRGYGLSPASGHPVESWQDNPIMVVGARSVTGCDRVLSVLKG